MDEKEKIKLRQRLNYTRAQLGQARTRKQQLERNISGTEGRVRQEIQASIDIESRSIPDLERQIKSMESDLGD